RVEEDRVHGREPAGAIEDLLGQQVGVAGAERVHEPADRQRVGDQARGAGDRVLLRLRGERENPLRLREVALTRGVPQVLLHSAGADGGEDAMTGAPAAADVRIRDYRPADLPALYEVCLRTGDAGQDATALTRDPTLLGEIYVGPYLAAAPGLAL